MVTNTDIADHLRTTPQTFAVGDMVEWISSNTRKVGEIIAIVRAGQTPTDVGYSKAGGGGIGRGHVSYIVKARKHYEGFSEPYGSRAVYWPLVSLLKPVSTPSVSGGKE